VAVNPISAHGPSSPGPVRAATRHLRLRTAPAATTAPASPQAGSLTAIGDSVMLGAVPDLQRAFPGVVVDAVEGRQAGEVFATIDAMLAKGRLGQRGHPADRNQREHRPRGAHHLLGKLAGRKVIILNVHVPRPWQNLDKRHPCAGGACEREGGPGRLERCGLRPPAVAVDDGVHLRTAGARQYTDLIAAALR